MTSFVRRVSAAALLLAARWRPRRSAPAQELQTGKPIRLIVGLAAGGGTDVTARLIAQKMSENMKATVMVENKAGGNFIPALKELTGSPADGHTLYFISTSTLITQALHPDYPFDLTKLTPITEVATGPLILVVKNDLGVKTLKDLVELAKKKPGKLSFGAAAAPAARSISRPRCSSPRPASRSTSPTIAAPGPALNDLLGGHIDGMFDAMPVMAAQAKEGKVTPIAVTSVKRSTALPNVPTMKEFGFPDYEMYGWFGILAPTGTPPAIAQKLRDEVAKAVADADVVKTLDEQGMEPRARSPPNGRNIWSRSSRSMPRSPRTRTSSRKSGACDEIFRTRQRRHVLAC